MTTPPIQMPSDLPFIPDWEGQTLEQFNQIDDMLITNELHHLQVREQVARQAFTWGFGAGAFTAAVFGAFHVAYRKGWLS